MLYDHAKTIWQAGVDAAKPQTLVAKMLRNPSLSQAIERADRILVVGAGKAGAAMAEAVETTLNDKLDRLEGIINVPENSPFQTNRITLHSARPVGSNHPTSQGVAGSEKILQLLSQASANDVALCLLSGGGSALLPAPVVGVSLEDKQEVTHLLHACGATINEMNCVRKHLSRVKGGRLAQAFSGHLLFSLIISDVIGDPLDVIASGPTAADSSTFSEAWEVLTRYHILNETPEPVRRYLQQGMAGNEPETLKELPENVTNAILGNNAQSLAESAKKAEELGYRVVNLGSFIEGETREVAITLAGVLRSILRDGTPAAPPVCLISGGETTVRLSSEPGKGGRNQEMVLAAALQMAKEETPMDWLILSGGTDGEDGPTDAAGAFADSQTLTRAQKQGLDARSFLDRNDAYHFFEPLDSLLKTGLTWTNVMDLRVILARQKA